MVRKIYLVVFHYYDDYLVHFFFFNKKKAERTAKEMNEQDPRYPYYEVEEHVIQDA